MLLSRLHVPTRANPFCVEVGTHGTPEGGFAVRAKRGRTCGRPGGLHPFHIPIIRALARREYGSTTTTTTGQSGEPVCGGNATSPCWMAARMSHQHITKPTCVQRTAPITYAVEQHGNSQCAPYLYLDGARGRRHMWLEVRKAPLYRLEDTTTARQAQSSCLVIAPPLHVEALQTTPTTHDCPHPTCYDSRTAHPPAWSRPRPSTRWSPSSPSASPRHHRAPPPT